MQARVVEVSSNQVSFLLTAILIVLLLWLLLWIVVNFPRRKVQNFNKPLPTTAGRYDTPSRGSW